MLLVNLDAPFGFNEYCLLIKMVYYLLVISCELVCLFLLLHHKDVGFACHTLTLAESYINGGST
jgi:hypothetical protein